MDYWDQPNIEATEPPSQDERRESESTIGFASDHDDTKACSQLSARSFARDWESAADAVYDNERNLTPSPPSTL